MLRSSPLVSIIIPCYNAECWIAEAIESCLAQSYQPLEIIVIDDGSTDASLRIIKSFGPRIKCESGPNRGGNHARNRGFALSSGEYIQFLDADDYILPEKIERQVRFLEATRSDAVYGDWRYQVHLPSSKILLRDVVVSGNQTDVLESLLRDWWVALLALLFRREVVVKCGGWDETLRVGQDRDFFIRVAMSGTSIVYQPGCYSVYRRYGNVTVGTSDRRRSAENHARVFMKAACALAEAGRLSPQYRQALSQSYFHLARLYYDMDRDEYRRLLGRALQLTPSFIPNESPLYNFSHGFFGFDGAERLASFYRRLRRLISSPDR